MAAPLSRRAFLGAAAAASVLKPGAKPVWAESFPARFRQQHPFEALYRYIEPGTDEFTVEKEAMEIAALLDRLPETKVLPLADDFVGTSPLPSGYRRIAADVSAAEFDSEARDFAGGLTRWLSSLGKISTARFYVLPEDKVRYEIASEQPDGLAYRVGHWKQQWRDGKLARFDPLEEFVTRAPQPWFTDVTGEMFSTTPSFQKQLAFGVPYWRSRLDSACGIDVYGQNGIAVGDIDNDGRDEIYVCQPGGLPNRLYRIRDDGTAEDLTESAGVGVLDDTACALFVDFRNSGWQDLVVLTSNRPLYFENRGDGTFTHRPAIFRFATTSRGTFTGMSAADYDGDGKVDLYICTYIHFQSEDQYNYPAPYHDARNGPPNFLFRNRLDHSGGGFFEDVTAQTGLDANNDRYSFAPAWCDYDRDGRPDLYVANDFGRNNLYKNEGGRFRDVARAAGVEDLGPGMSAAWFDYDGDGRPDLYTTNMWTAAGKRVTADEHFAPVATGELKDEYRRHTKGNSLHRNRGDGTFEETGAAEGVEMGRWSWSGDGLDFDGDGTPEIYITCGMITNSSRRDLMSFFWRQVVAKSPTDATPTTAYEHGWNALNQLIREDYSWNGREPNVFYARRNGRYYDFSGVSGLDWPDDSRAFAATDFTGDGRLDLFLKSRLGPQVRALANRAGESNNRIVLSLLGTKSNRDAIGAWVEVEHGGKIASQGLQAGSGYLSQHTKRLHFGLGDSRTAKVKIRWPSGLDDQIGPIKAGVHYRIREGGGIIGQSALKPASPASKATPVDGRNKEVSEAAWLLEPVPLPERRAGPGCVCLVSGQDVTPPPGVRFDVIDLKQASEDISACYSLFRRYLFDYRAGLTLPFVMLIDERGRCHKVAFSIPTEDQAKRDLDAMRKPDRLSLALPFAGKYYGHPSRNYFRHGAALAGKGYPEQSLAYFDEVLAGNPENFKAQLAVGQIHLGAGREAEARPHLEKALKLNPNSPAVWNNLGGLDLNAGDHRAAAEKFEKALAIDPDLPFALVNAGQAHERAGDAAKAEKMFRRALALNQGDFEAANHLGLLLAKQQRHVEAKRLFEQAIEAKRDYTSAINNLAVLYLNTNKIDDAIAALRYGIRVGPQEEVLYLNLARIFVQQGDRARARDVLQQLQQEVPDSPVARKALDQLGVE